MPLFFGNWETLGAGVNLVEVPSAATSPFCIRHSSIFSRRSSHRADFSRSTPTILFSHATLSSATSIVSFTLSCLSLNQTMAASILPILEAIVAYLESIDSRSARALSNVVTQASNSLMAVPLASHLL